MPVLLTEGDVRAVLPMDDLIAAMEVALERFSARAVRQPLRTVVEAGSLAGLAPVVQVGAAVVAGVLAFLAVALMLRIEEVDVLRRQLTARWRR